MTRVPIPVVPAAHYFLWRHPHGRARAHHPLAALCLRRMRLHGVARGQPPGQHIAPGGPGLGPERRQDLVGRMGRRSVLPARLPTPCPTGSTSATCTTRTRPSSHRIGRPAPLPCGTTWAFRARRAPAPGLRRHAKPRPPPARLLPQNAHVQGPRRPLPRGLRGLYLDPGLVAAIQNPRAATSAPANSASPALQWKKPSFWRAFLCNGCGALHLGCLGLAAYTL